MEGHFWDKVHFLCVHSDEANFHAVGDGLPYGEAHEARNSGQPPAKSQGGTEAFIPTTQEELHPVNNHVTVPGGDPPQGRLRQDPRLQQCDCTCDRPWARGPS